MYQAVIFDFFGTLTRAVSRGPAHARIARLLGCDLDDFVRELNATFMARSVGALGDPAAALCAVAARLGSHPSPRLVRLAVDDRIAAVAADTRLRPGVAPLLHSIRRLGLSTALISDCGPELPAILPHMPIAPLLDTAVLSIDIGRHKPDPEIYYEACRRLDVPPSRCLYIGDGGSHELSGAAAIGMTAVRLAAPDLGDHLVFGLEPKWSGPSVEFLAEILPLIRAHPSAIRLAS